jgi:hypothetical protein
MNLINRYIAEVGRYLPEKDRSDIEAEVRSMLEDMIDERRAASGQKTNDELITEVLEQVGDPRLLAYKYAPPKRYLIGPEWYEVYTNVLQRVLFTALPIYLAVQVAVTLSQESGDFGSTVGKVATGAISIVVHILFWVTLAFVWMERSGEPMEELSKSGPRKWSIAQLPELPRSRQISIGETLVDIILILLLIFWIVRPAFLGDSDVSLLNPALWRGWLPALLAILGLNLVHDVFQLKIGNWTPALTATNVILGIAAIVYIVALVVTQDLVNPAFLTMLEQRGATHLIETARWSLYISAAIIAGIYAWDIVNSIRLSRQLSQ